MALIIGIGGVSRSGKTHLSHDIVWHYRQQNKRAIAVRLDDFVKEIDLIPVMKGETNWEIPASVDYQLAISAIRFFDTNFDVVIIEGHLVYANEALADLIQLPFLLQTNKATYHRRKAADIRWGEIPTWYTDYIWTAFLAYGSAKIAEPININSDYPSISDVETFLDNLVTND